MNSVLCSGVQPAGSVGAGGSAVHAITRSGFACVRTGLAATSTAAGLVEVWSSIRFEISRGWVSNTMLPDRWFAYVLDGTAGLPGPKKPAATPSAVRKLGEVRRRN